MLVYRIITGAHSWALKHWRLRSIVTLDQYIEQSIHPLWTSLLTAEGHRHRQAAGARTSASEVAGRRRPRAQTSGSKAALRPAIRPETKAQPK